MRRGPSPITVGVGATTIVLSAMTLYVLWHPSGAGSPTAPSPSLESQSPAEPTAGLPANLARASDETTRPKLEPLSGEAAEADAGPSTGMATEMPTAIAPVSWVDAAPVDAPGAPTAQRRARVIAAHNQLLKREADERVFESRKVSETNRAAIRRINETFAEETRVFLDRPAPATRMGGGVVSPEAEQHRHAALDGVLGPDEARAFEAAERLAARALVPRYRRQWSRELHDSGAAAGAASPPSPP